MDGIKKEKYSERQMSRMFDNYSKVKYKFSCGHSVIIGANYDKIVCRFCGKYVFKNKKDEFLYRLKERM